MRIYLEPNINVATPNNYCLGAGDEVIIDVWCFEDYLEKLSHPKAICAN